LLLNCSQAKDMGMLVFDKYRLADERAETYIGL